MNSQTLHLYLRLIVVLSFVFQSHGSKAHARGFDSLARSPVAKAKWTVMLYMNGDNNLDSSAIADFQEMAKVKYDPRVNVVIQLDRFIGLDTDTDWGETRRFLMRENLKPTRSNSLPDFSEEANMGDPATLASFVTWAKNSFPAERYMLIIWSHGDGWRRLIDDEQLGEENSATAARTHRRLVNEAEDLLLKGELTDSKLAAMNLSQTSLEPQFRTISEDQTNGSDKLYIREIQDALEGVFKGQDGLEVIGFDACLMQMIEVGYAVRKVARVMVGSEELEPSDGWRYDDWLERLVKNPNIDGEEVGKLIVDSYKKNYEEKKKRGTTLSAVRVSKNEMKRLATAVSLLARELISSLDTHLPQIKQARRSCSVFAPRRGYHGIDLHRFSFQLAQAEVTPQLRSRALEVAKLIESLVIDNYASATRQGEFGSRGLAIYFPANNESYQSDKYKNAYTDENEFQAVQFVREQIWDNFLHAYFKRV
jgi:Clostripain family.